MAIFPQLERQPPSQLMTAFAGNFTNGMNVPRDERQLFFDEAAIAIAASGSKGVGFLLDQATNAKSEKLHAVLVGLSFAPTGVVSKRRRALREFLLAHVHDPRPLIAAEAIDTLSRLGFRAHAKDIHSLLHHESPYVVGSALRFLSRHDPKKAIPQLLKALRSASPIIRQNGIDELDELQCTSALPKIRRLLEDPEPHVRQAAETAVANLEEIVLANGARHP
jgi:HEAT repeat protein